MNQHLDNSDPSRRAGDVPRADAAANSNSPGGSPQDCDPAAAIARLGGFEDLYRALLVSLFNDSSGSLAKLRLAVEQGDAPLVQFSAHSLKGLAVTCGANGVAAAAALLEAMGRGAELGESQRTLAALDHALSAARRELAGYLQPA